MSQIQALPKDILANITPYLVSGETVTQALLQDNKKPNIIWLISTNQAIILHGQQEPNSKPIILVYALDEIKEIDYLQKSDDIQINICSGVNSSKAVFHFEISAKKEVEKFFLEFGDLITYRYLNEKGKIVVVQRALPVGDKERHKFGRGKKLEVKEQHGSQTSKSKEQSPSSSGEIKAAPAANKPAMTSVDIEQRLLANLQKKSVENQKSSTATATNAATVTEVKLPAPPTAQQTVSQAKPAEKEAKQAEVKATAAKKEAEKPAANVAPKEITKTADKPKTDGNPQAAKEVKPAVKKEIDYGSPVFFIGVTIISTAVGFLCLSFFKTISRIVTFFKKH